jgi:hypothetical protein
VSEKKIVEIDRGPFPWISRIGQGEEPTAVVALAHFCEITVIVDGIYKETPEHMLYTRRLKGICKWSSKKENVNKDQTACKPPLRFARHRVILAEPEPEGIQHILVD